MIERCERESVPVPQIYETKVSKLLTYVSKEDIVKYVPRFDCIKTLCERRRKHQPQLPKSLEEIDLPESYKETVNFKRSLLFDSNYADRLRLR